MTNTITPAQRELLDTIRKAVDENDNTDPSTRYRAPLGTVPSDTDDFRALVDGGFVFIERGIGLGMQTRYLLLDEMVEELSNEFQAEDLAFSGLEPVVTNYESGGHVAYAVWLTEYNDSPAMVSVILSENRDDCEVWWSLLTDRREFESFGEAVEAGDITVGEDHDEFALDYDAEGGATVWQFHEETPLQVLVRRDEFGPRWVLFNTESFDA